MAQETAPLVWVDMEMSGLVPDRDRILEVAIVVTDGELATIAEAPVIVDRSADWRPLEMPSERLDLSMPVMEEISEVPNAPQLPSDRLPLYSPDPG